MVKVGKKKPLYVLMFHRKGVIGRCNQKIKSNAFENIFRGFKRFNRLYVLLVSAVSFNSEQKRNKNNLKM